MTAFTVNGGSTSYYETFSTPSVNATLDTWTISNGTTLVVRTDSYACNNHSLAAGSLDNVTFSGTGGTLQFDPTYTRQISYTGGSGNSPAYGTTITQGGVSGVFQGCWADWQSDPVAAGAAIPASGYMKLGGVTGGAFAAGALTGITATCSGADIQSWIEVRGADTASFTIARIGKLTGPSTTIWFDLGATNGSAGQVVQCPTTATIAGVFPAIWIETSAGSGVYKRYNSVGSQVAISTTRTDASCAFFWQTTSGIVIGYNGTNNVGYVPPTGCNIRIPAVILTCCTRSAGGSGARVLPNATLTTRQKLVTTSGGYIDLKGVVCNWYFNANTASYLNLSDCAISDTVVAVNIGSAIAVSNITVAPTQAQVNAAFVATGLTSGGTVSDSSLWRFNGTTSGAPVAFNTACTGLTYSDVVSGFITERTAGLVASFYQTACDQVYINNCTTIGGCSYSTGSQNIEVNNLSYYDGAITTTTGAGTQTSSVQFSACFSGCKVDGFTLPIAANGPFFSIVASGQTSGLKVRNIGTYASPLALNSAVTAYIFSSNNYNVDTQIDRCYATGTRSGTWNTNNTDNGLVISNCSGDYADTTSTPSKNAVVRSCGYVGTSAGQTAVYGSHFQTRFSSTTAGILEVTCNEPTVTTTNQCYITSGTPKFNASGQIIMPSSGDQVVFEMQFYALGFTAFTNSLPTVVGTNVTSAGSGVWGNFTLTFQVDTGSGYGGSWLLLTAANLIAQTITDTTGFKLKLRATCNTGNSTNALTTVQIAMTTTSSAQSTNLYPMDLKTLTLTGLVTGSDIVVLDAGTTTVITSADSIATTSYSYAYETIKNVDIGIIKAGYKVKYLRNYALTSADVSIPIAQEIDRDYV